MKTKTKKRGLKNEQAAAREQGMRDGMRLLDSVAGPAVERAIAEAVAARDEQWLQWIEEERQKLRSCGVINGVSWFVLERLRARVEGKP